MVPTSLVGVLVFLAAFAPGFVWVRVAEARTLRADRSPLFETVELGFVGATASLIAAALVGLTDAWLDLGSADFGR